MLSPASRAGGPSDGRRDFRDDIRADEISPYVFDDIRDELTRESRDSDAGGHESEHEGEEVIDHPFGIGATVDVVSESDDEVIGSRLNDIEHGPE